MPNVREPESSNEPLGRITSISAGAGAVLVFLPSAALFFGHRALASEPLIGLPTVAIFGIVIMLGALALVATMYARLDLDCREEALALPPGSIRAVIAMALVVLFALMSVMLYNSLSTSGQTIEHLSESAKKALVTEPTNHVTAVIPVPCPARSASAAASAGGASAASQPASHASTPASGASAVVASSTGAVTAADEVCGPGAPFSYTVHLGNVAPSAAADFAKQLLTLIGTLMTSVVSFYFAARSADASMRTALKAVAPTTPATPNPRGAKDDDTDHEHGDVKNPTEDKDLPPATGGIAT